MREKVLLIGASTGGPSQIKEMLGEISSLSCTVIIAQHMREEVLPFFINDLQESMKEKVYTTPLKTSFFSPSIIVCSHSSIVKKSYGAFEIVTDTSEQQYTPDINKLFNSFCPFVDELDIKVLIMTGIGRDGVDGAINLKHRGVSIIAQDEKSCPVYGMPKAAIESGIVDEIKTLSEIKEYFRGL
ncbi:MAG: chemotaxis protein CheB [Campylobacterota bacterium]|nr:chemotaxis protein CheB [Campylobacterota bacterium]